MSLPIEWRTTTHPNDYDIERSTVITVLAPNLVENIVGKWLWDTFGETAFYEADTERGAGYWKVTAPRRITEVEQQILRDKRAKRRRSSAR